MASVTLDIYKNRVQPGEKVLWSLKIVARDAISTTLAGENDSKIFVWQKKGGNSPNEFNHVASPTDMSEVADSPDSILSKDPPYFRSNTLEAHYNDPLSLQESLSAITADINTLMRNIEAAEYLSQTEPETVEI